MNPSFYPCNQAPLDQVHTKGRFQNRVVIVTGGASGIGFATVHRFCNDGATVAIFDCNVSLGESAVQHLKAEGIGNNVQFYCVDVSSAETCIKTAEKVASENNGKIHHLVNAAVYFNFKGITSNEEDWRKSFDVNVVGYSNMVQAVYPYMVKAGGSNCSIVNIGSDAASRAQSGRWTYSATKGAIKSLTKCMALDMSKHGIRVNSVAPAWTWSPISESFGTREALAKVVANSEMLRRDAETSEVAAVIAFLCSKDASFMTGSDTHVCGGYLAMGPEQHGEDSNFAGSKQ